MAECEICGNYSHIDDIRNCPVCDLELCPACYENHVPHCIAQKYDDIEQNDEEEIIPHICPNCGERLNLDMDDYCTLESGRMYCDHCDFEQELDDFQIAEVKSWNNDDEDVDSNDIEDVDM